MENKSTDNVLAGIEEDFKDIVKNECESKLEDDEFLDKTIEEFDVVDSWEVGGVDDFPSADDRSTKSRRRSRGSSRPQRREDKVSRRDSDRHNFRSHRVSHRRQRSRSHSKPSDYRRPRKSSEKTEDEKHFVEHPREPISVSIVGSEKLPDLKCTTSVETGEVNVVLLSEDKGVLDSVSDKVTQETDDSPRKHPVLLKNPFAIARLRRRNSQSPDELKARELELSPRRRPDQPGSEVRSFGSKNKDRSLSPYRPRSRHRTSPYPYDRSSRRRSISPDRYGNKRTFSDSRPRDSARRYSRSREGSVLSRVSSKSSLSFISSDDNSPRDHDRKRSPLRPKTFSVRPKLRKIGHSPSDEQFLPSSEEFDHKLSLLLKEGKQKQSFIGEPTATNYPTAAWKPEWNSGGVPQMPSENYTVDSVLKNNYDSSAQQCAYPGFPAGQYNQNYYNNNPPTNYVSAYPGGVDNAVQPPFDYANHYPTQLTNQYYPQTAPATGTLPSAYSSPPKITQYQPSIEQQQQALVVNNSMPLPTANTAHPPYTLSGDHLNYSGINAQPVMSLQGSLSNDSSLSRHAIRTAEWSKYSNNKRVPTRTNIPLTNEGNAAPEEDPMRTPPPPVISDTWREIESGEKKLSTLLEEASKKHEVISRCEEMLQKLARNDPLMERFKIMQCENMIHFSLKEDSKNSVELHSRNAIRTARRRARMKRYQSPLLRKKSNPYLRFMSWIPGDKEVNHVVEPVNCAPAITSSTKPSKSILKNPVKEEMCHSCVIRRDCMVSVCTQTDELVTNEMGVQVENEWNNYYPDNNYENSNSSYPAWYRR